jgi:hypothetical protein
VAGLRHLWVLRTYSARICHSCRLNPISNQSRKQVRSGCQTRALNPVIVQSRRLSWMASARLSMGASRERTPTQLPPPGPPHSRVDLLQRRPLRLSRAVANRKIRGTYLLINNNNPDLNLRRDLMVTIAAFSGDLPDFARIDPGGWFGRTINQRWLSWKKGHEKVRGSLLPESSVPLHSPTRAGTVKAMAKVAARRGSGPCLQCAMPGSNQRHPACKAGALPLS